MFQTGLGLFCKLSEPTFLMFRQQSLKTYKMCIKISINETIDMGYYCILQKIFKGSNWVLGLLMLIGLTVVMTRSHILGMCSCLVIWFSNMMESKKTENGSIIIHRIRAYDTEWCNKRSYVHTFVDFGELDETSESSKIKIFAITMELEKLLSKHILYMRQHFVKILEKWCIEIEWKCVHCQTKQSLRKC